MVKLSLPIIIDGQRVTVVRVHRDYSLEYDEDTYEKAQEMIHMFPTFDGVEELYGSIIEDKLEITVDGSYTWIDINLNSGFMRFRGATGIMSSNQNSFATLWNGINFYGDEDIIAVRFQFEGSELTASVLRNNVVTIMSLEDFQELAQENAGYYFSNINKLLRV